MTIDNMMKVLNNISHISPLTMIEVLSNISNINNRELKVISDDISGKVAVAWNVILRQ